MTRPVRIGTRDVGPGYPCLIVAEPGSNHNGRLDMAIKLIDVAADAGVNAVKFQTFQAELHYVRKTPHFSYLQEMAPHMSTFELIKEYELPREWHPVLKKHCHERGVIFLSTPSDRSAVDELVDVHDMCAIKIASFEAVDLPFIEYCARKDKPLIVSTGMCNLGDIEDIMATLKMTGNRNVILLHCVSLYPTRPDQVNLRAMETIARAFKVPVGLSDHTMGIDIPLAAVALGACMIEKHYTLDRNLKGPDHRFALEPQELKAMVQGIRNVESALGSFLKEMLPEEEEMARLGRRSIIARVRIEQGTVITPEMLATKRPGYGIRPKLLPVIVGRVARQLIEEDEVITWDMV